MNRIYSNAHDRLRKSSRVVLYGASLAALGVLDQWKLPVAYLVDDTPGVAGRTLSNGLSVYASEKLSGENKDNVFVLITAWTQNAILKISERLNGLGFRYGENFVDCSVLHFDSMSAKLQNHLNLKTDLEAFSICRLWCLNCYASSISAIAGTWLFTELARLVGQGVKGNVAECGVYQGGNAFISLMLSPTLRERRYQLFDSFEGFPDISPVDPITRQNHFRDVSLASIRNRFASFPNVEIHKGYFDKTFPTLTPADYALVYIDCDLYQSTLDCLHYFYPRLRSGGVLLLHDFWLPDEAQSRALGLDLYAGVKKACMEFFSESELARLLVFPETTHALIVKE